MNIREQQESREHEYMSPYSSFSDESRGRDKPEPQCDMRTIYQRDRDRILHSKSFRRLKHKTQVFLAPEGDHYRTRLTHTLEVAQIARSISRALRLNEDLTEAIALGHDLGHTPFGHAGERTLDKICPLGFSHYRQSIRVVEFLEKDGAGLNLTWEVRDGIVNHRTAGHPSTLEGKVVRLSDKIAYINHDIDDAIRARIFSEDYIPKEYTDVLGTTTKSRLNTLISDIIKCSIDKDDIIMSDTVHKAMTDLRQFMFDRLYTNPAAKSEEIKVCKLITELYNYYIANIEELPDNYKRFIYERGEKPERVVCDYIAGMSDQYSISKFENIFVPGATGKADVQKMYLQVITSAFGHNNIFAFISWKGWKEELIMYSSEVIEEVISRNDIVDVISGYIKLKKNGSSYVGLCPFHNEKSPSFSVSGTKQMYHCFGCGVGGNVITFVMEYENYTFPEAVKMLGERAGMELPETDYSAEDRKDRDIKTRLLEINKIAATYYYHQLKSEAGKSGLDYLVKRGLSDKTINSFGLGYAPQSTGELYRMLKDKGYDDGILKESGLLHTKKV